MSDKKKIRTITGQVVSDKMDKTITVLIERKVKFKMYKKFVKRSTKYLVHDEKNLAKVDDVVSITSCRPLSKNKTFKLVSVLGN